MLPHEPKGTDGDAIDSELGVIFRAWLAAPRNSRSHHRQYRDAIASFYQRV
jgi:hypothetical protein